MTRTDSRQRAEVDLDHHSRNSEKTPTARSGGCANQVAGGVFAALRRILGLVDYASVFEASRDDELFNSAPSIGVPPSPIPFPSCRSNPTNPKH
ncbi:cytochrome P450 family protein [Mycobacterium xenopi 4042]|uniref:Cytochrome P450 family protein n=1 Tax=Mycobacterium xenopi 4042 TaxID=1299334 RepID=X8AIP4_MYCXE|nr:cytochrome P450 family protein [Mycobacterium xenopi 4042]